MNKFETAIPVESLKRIREDAELAPRRLAEKHFPYKIDRVMLRALNWVGDRLAGIPTYEQMKSFEQQKPQDELHRLGLVCERS